jgi:hypothetical protein
MIGAERQFAETIDEAGYRAARISTIVTGPFLLAISAGKLSAVSGGLIE